MKDAATIEQVLELMVGTKIPAVKGRLKNLYERKNGKAQDDREWSMQAGSLEGEDGQSWIRITIWNHPDLSDLKGKVVLIRGKHTEKQGIIGIELQEYKDNPKLEIKGAAQILLDGAPIKSGEDNTFSPPTQSAPTATPQGASNIRTTLRKTANLVAAAYTAAKLASKTVKEEINIEIAGAEFHTLARSLIITLEKDGLLRRIPEDMSVPEEQPIAPPPPSQPPPKPQPKFSSDGLEDHDEIPF